MSLRKQLWLLLAFVFGALFLTCAALWVLLTKDQFEQQLTLPLTALGGVFVVATIIAFSMVTRLLRSAAHPLQELKDTLDSQNEPFMKAQLLAVAQDLPNEFHALVLALERLEEPSDPITGLQLVHSSDIELEPPIDSISGLQSRTQFLNALKMRLKQQDGSQEGVLCIVHLSEPAVLNRTYGRHSVDDLLGAMGRSLIALCAAQNAWRAGRLNGADFAVLAPRATDAKGVAKRAQTALAEVLVEREMIANIELPAAAANYAPDETVGQLLSRLDGVLSAAVVEGESAVYVPDKPALSGRPVREQMEEWRTILRDAFVEQRFSLTAYPVAGIEGNLLHLESPARLHFRGKALTASQFLPWINRLELAVDLDKQVVRLALQAIVQTNTPVCVNLTAAALRDRGFLPWISETLCANEPVADKLWLEVAEIAALRYINEFTKLCGRVGSWGTHIGVEHAGHQLAEIGQLADAGIDYMKIDGLFIRDIDCNPANQTLVRTLCIAGRAKGTTMIAEGVYDDAEWKTLRTLGIDGVTGPGVTATLKQGNSAALDTPSSTSNPGK